MTNKHDPFESGFTYYDMLELRQGASATPREIDAAYAKVIGRIEANTSRDPDTDPQLMKGLIETRQLIDRAHEVLSDPKKRPLYDKALAAVQAKKLRGASPAQSRSSRPSSQGLSATSTPSRKPRQQPRGRS